MFALLLLVVLAVVAFGTLSAAIGRSKYRWIALTSSVLALLMLVSAAILLLGAGAVAIGTSGSVAQILVMACLVGMVIACVVCVISGSIAISRRDRQHLA